MKTAVDIRRFREDYVRLFAAVSVSYVDADEAAACLFVTGVVMTALRCFVVREKWGIGSNYAT